MKPPLLSSTSKTKCRWFSIQFISSFGLSSILARLVSDIVSNSTKINLTIWLNKLHTSLLSCSSYCLSRKSVKSVVYVLSSLLLLSSVLFQTCLASTDSTTPFVYDYAFRRLHLAFWSILQYNETPTIKAIFIYKKGPYAQDFAEINLKNIKPRSPNTLRCSTSFLAARQCCYA